MLPNNFFAKAPLFILIGAAALATGCAEKSGTRANAQSSANRVATRDPEVLSQRGEARLQREVRHQLVMLPYYGIFDNLAFEVSGSSVSLYGQVTRPTLKSEAESVVNQIEGVDRVINNIEVLPLSPGDDRIRIAAYRTIYGQSTLNRYGLQAIPPIHIIVRNGNITLEGVVANEVDKSLAGIQANSVPGVFSVTNNLRVEK